MKVAVQAFQPNSTDSGHRFLAQSNQDCCLSYMRTELPRRTINGYTEQLSNEVCDIGAIIFHTKGGLKACANPEDNWVKKRLLWLSKKLKKMSM
ncbi:C-C motif chemokine 20-like isoform X2 [Chrysemys picta bellii]|uniref:C-C motif chemokine 20-like isoform X2 n=1 Tax=Chrysemys picta bellii TaxID=8478 RepID=UPI0032B2F803